MQALQEERDELAKSFQVCTSSLPDLLRILSHERL